MSATNVTPFQKPVNREERKLVGRVHRMCARHGLKLYHCRDKQFHLNDPGYQLRLPL